MRSSILKEIFKDYVAHEIEFLVLRNHEDIPNKISIDNDLDLLVKADCNKKLIKIMQNYSFKVHIEKFSSNEYLYKSLPHIHFYNFKNNIHFDVVNNLSYKSPNNN